MLGENNYTTEILEKELKQLKEKLCEIEKERDFYREVLKKMQAVVHVNDLTPPKGSLVKWINEGVKNVSGWEPEDIVDNPDFLPDNIIGDSIVNEKSRNHFKEDPDNHQIGIYKLRSKDGSAIWYQTVIVPFEKDENGHPVKSLSVAFDVTDEVFNVEELEQRIREYKTKLNSMILEKLTKKEMECFQLIVRGKTLKKIACELNRSYHTIESHKKNLFTKLKVNKISDLVKLAHEFGLVEPTNANG